MFLRFDSTIIDSGASSWAEKEWNCDYHVFIPCGDSVVCDFCDYKPSPEELAASMNALESIREIATEWPERARK